MFCVVRSMDEVARKAYFKYFLELPKLKVQHFVNCKYHFINPGLALQAYSNLLDICCEIESLRGCDGSARRISKIVRNIPPSCSHLAGAEWLG